MARGVPRPTGSVNVLPAFLGSVAATGVALGLMFWARATYQIRTLPERVMEWLLLFVPTDLFEKGLQAYGANAKDIALYGAYAVMAIVLVVLGFIILRRGIRAIATASVALWLFAMGVVMPVTGAGFFAIDLFQDVLLTNLSYLGIAFAYATVLLLAHLLCVNNLASVMDTNRPAPAPWARRAFLGGLIGTGFAYAFTLWTGRSAGTISSGLPRASIPQPQYPSQSTPAPASPTAQAVQAVSTPTAEPAVVAGAPASPITVPTVPPSVTPASLTPTAIPSAVPTSAAASPAAAPVVSPVANTPVSSVAPKIVIPPPPAPARQIARDKDGSLTGAVPPPGQVAPLYTPNQIFYITTKNAGGDPIVDATRWRLAIDGAVTRPVQLDLSLLYQLPAVTTVKTLECISNFVQNCE